MRWLFVWHMAPTNEAIARQAASVLSARGDWVPLPKILELRISQFGARIFELRPMGLRIVNRTRTVAGVKHSWYRLESSPVAQSRDKKGTAVPVPTTSDSLFSDLPERVMYPD